MPLLNKIQNIFTDVLFKIFRNGVSLTGMCGEAQAVIVWIVPDLWIGAGPLSPTFVSAASFTGIKFVSEKGTAF